MGLGTSASERKIESLVDGAGPRPTSSGRFGGARADFVASLGRRAVELQSALAVWQGDPKSVRARDDVMRRVHALVAGSRLLRFAELAERLSGAHALLQSITARGELTGEELANLKQTFAEIPALAWANEPLAARPSESVAKVIDNPTTAEVTPPAPIVSAQKNIVPAPMVCPSTVLVVGPAVIADALGDEATGEERFDVERTEDTTVALDLARAFAPDVVIVDDDLPGVRELVAALLDDPMTEPVPIVVLGRWARADEAGPYVALGIARALCKPVSPSTLARACAEVTATYVRGDVAREPLGELTVDQLGARLAEELRRGLCDATTTKARAVPVTFGDGSDVLAPLWTAVARIRDVVTIHSEGSVRFTPTGPEGALPQGTWQAEGAQQRATTGARLGATTSLAKASVLVADDDPAVTWFLAGVLKAEGAVVHEARDGSRALDLALRMRPDLVVSDVLMPELDGFGLCRALKSDVLMRDVPVVLLSWKDDLLQRARELGAGADGYLRKESSGAAVVQRVRELLHPRARITARLAAGGEVRGRLDGLTTFTLLRLAGLTRPSCTVSVRDAAFLYEIEIRDGQPARATRTAPDGSFERGSAVLASLLAVGAGKFVVSPALDGALDKLHVRAELFGTLAELTEPYVTRVRAAQRLCSGTALLRVDRVALDLARIAPYVDATPDPLRSLVRAMAAGASPREMIVSGQIAARVIEDGLADMALRDAVSAVLDRDGNDLLPDAVVAECELLRGKSNTSAPIPEPELVLPPPMLTPLPEGVRLDDDRSNSPGPAMIAAVTEGSKRVASPPPPRVIVAPPSAPAAPSAQMPSAPAPVAPAAPAPRQVPESLGSLKPPPVMVAPEPPPPPRAPEPPPPPRAAPAPIEETPARAAAPRPSAYSPHAHHAPLPPIPTRDPKVALWVLLAVLGVAFAVGARWLRERPIPEPVTPPPAAAVAPEAPAPALPPAPAPEKVAPPTIDPSAEDLALRPDDKVAADQGMIEVVAGTGNNIYVDGRLIGKGPVVKLPVSARTEPYQVRVELRGEDQIRFVTVKQGRLTRLRVAPPWSR